jgi:hypothetical protein
MKTKISATVIGLLFLMSSCGSPSDQPKGEEQPTATTEIATPTKFTLKASNMKYITIAADSSLVANEADPTKALIFEKIDQGDGKSVLKMPNGKYCIEDRNFNNKLFANSPNPWGWETFEIIALDNTKINIKASTGKFVTVDKSNGMISGNSDNPSDSEIFIMESK